MIVALIFVKYRPTGADISAVDSGSIGPYD